MKMIVKYMTVLTFIFCVNNNIFSQTDENWTDIGSSYAELEGEWVGTAVSVVKNNSAVMIV